MPRPRSPEPIAVLTASIYERQIDLLRAESLMTGRPVSVIVRRALDKVLAAEEEPSAKNHELACAFVSRAQAERLRHLALRTGESVAAIVGRAMEKELESATPQLEVNPNAA